MFRLLVQQVRRDRITLPIWILGTVFLLVVAAAAISQEFDDAAGRASILRVALATPALLALRGIPNGDSLGSGVNFQSFAFLALTIGLMNTFLATRHGRGDEEKGRRELVLATPVSRRAPFIATLMLGVIANGVFGVLATVGYVATGLDAGGAILSAGALALTGLAFLGIGLLAGQLTATSRAANGVGTVAVLAAYAFRGAGDALGTPDLTRISLEPGWPSWLSVIGWGQQILPFTENRLWPLAVIGALAVVTLVVAFVVQTRRDVGASLLAERRGRAVARAGLRSPFALAWRLQWPTLVAWTAGSTLLGAVLGSLVTAISKASIDNPQIEGILASLGHTTQADVSRSLVVAITVIVGAVAGAAGVQAVLRLREEEIDGLMESVLAAPLSRYRWMLAFLVTAVVSVLVVLSVTGVAAALSFAGSGDDENAWFSLAQCLVQAPAALSFVAAAAVVVAVLPRFAVALSWVIYAAGIGIGLFGGLANFPDGVMNASPITHVPTLPTDDWVPTIVVGAIVLVVSGIALLRYRRRDLAA